MGGGKGGGACETNVLLSIDTNRRLLNGELIDMRLRASSSGSRRRDSSSRDGLRSRSAAYMHVCIHGCIHSGMHACVYGICTKMLPWDPEKTLPGIYKVSLQPRA